MNQTFFPWGGFEMQYKDIIPQILIEPILINGNDSYPCEYEIYCFNGVPKIYQKVQYSIPMSVTVYDEKYRISDVNFNSNYIKLNEEAGENLKEAVILSKILPEEFKLVRCFGLSKYLKADIRNFNTIRGLSLYIYNNIDIYSKLVFEKEEFKTCKMHFREKCAVCLTYKLKKIQRLKEIL